MQNVILIVLLACVNNMQSVFTKIYNKKLDATVENSCFLSIVRILINTVFFLIMSGFRIELHIPSIPYAVAYGVMMSINLICCTMALMIGSFALTSLMGSASMVLVAVYGMVILQEPVQVTMIIGIILLMCSLILLNVKDSDGCKLTLRWWVYVLIFFICNAGCMLSMKLHQLQFPGEYSNEFMVFGTIICEVLLCAYCLIKKIEFKQAKTAFSRGWIAMLGVGIALALANYLQLMLNVRIPASIMYSTLPGMVLITTALISRLVYHEQFSRRQKLAFFVGTCSVILMNL